MQLLPRLVGAFLLAFGLVYALFPKTPNLPYPLMLEQPVWTWNPSVPEALVDIAIARQKILGDNWPVYHLSAKELATFQEFVANHMTQNGRYLWNVERTNVFIDFVNFKSGNADPIPLAIVWKVFGNQLQARGALIMPAEWRIIPTTEKLVGYEVTFSPREKGGITMILQRLSPDVRVRLLAPHGSQKENQS
ncbi:hypothetical protein BCV70DRAFT_197473 [Testicularia cyperi]|uniref:Uncharacterized protein n=1 Tax=Testicularia cyperi TaxID=1882483 RepID=A0A317XY74_9BASI|nr:hypothetical protein BCV70DRAFT_197473 [Testicularia cyperi]